MVLADPDVQGIGLMFDTDQFNTYATLRAGSTDLREALKLLLLADLGKVDDARLDLEMKKIKDGTRFKQEVTKELFGPYAYQAGKCAM